MCIRNSESSVTSFSLAKLLGSIARYSITRVKKRHIFLANIAKILKHSLSVQESFFGSKFNGKMLKSSNQSEFLPEN